MTLRSLSLLAVIPLSFSVFGACGLLVACTNLKDSVDPNAADGATNGSSPSADGGDIGSTDDGSTTSPTSGTDAGTDATTTLPGNGDPRWAQGPVAADDPDITTAYTITDGDDGALVLDKNNGVVWQDAVPPDLRSLAAAKSYCDTLVYDKLSGWRLPTRMEALNVMSIKKTYGDSKVTTSAFSTLPNDPCFWTASAWVATPNFGWQAGSAGMSSGLSSEQCAARCVRGPAIPATATAPKYELSDATAVKDPVTGLTWEKTPPNSTTLRLDADTRCKALMIGGKPARLPTVKELATIIDETKSSPAATPAFGDYESTFYTSNAVWTVSFSTGAFYQSSSNNGSYARCVVGP